MRVASDAPATIQEKLQPQRSLLGTMSRAPSANHSDTHSNIERAFLLIEAEGGV